MGPLAYGSADVTKIFLEDWEVAEGVFIAAGRVESSVFVILSSLGCQPVIRFQILPDCPPSRESMRQGKVRPMKFYGLKTPVLFGV